MAKTTLIRQLRERLGWPQHRFAQALEKSYASLRGYEYGRRPPPEVLGHMLALAHQHGFTDLARQIEAYAGAIDQVRFAGEFGPGSSGLPKTRNAFHALLDGVLDSGDRQAIAAVGHVLLVYFGWTQDHGRVEKQG